MLSVVTIKLIFMMLCIFLEQTEKLAAFLQKYWSVELFWFPFNSLLDWVGKLLPTASGRQLNVAEFPEPPAVDTEMVRN